MVSRKRRFPPCDHPKLVNCFYRHYLAVYCHVLLTCFKAWMIQWMNEWTNEWMKVDLSILHEEAWLNVLSAGNWRILWIGHSTGVQRGRDATYSENIRCPGKSRRGYDSALSLRWLLTVSKLSGVVEPEGGGRAKGLGAKSRWCEEHLEVPGVVLEC